MFAVTFILSHFLTVSTHNSDSLHSPRARSVKSILESDLVCLWCTHTHVVVRSLSPSFATVICNRGRLQIKPLSHPHMSRRNFIRDDTPHRYRNGVPGRRPGTYIQRDERACTREKSSTTASLRWTQLFSLFLSLHRYTSRYLRAKVFHRI